MIGVGLEVKLENGTQMLATYYGWTPEQVAALRDQIGARVTLTRTWEDGRPIETRTGTLLGVLDVDSSAFAVPEYDD